METTRPDTTLYTVAWSLKVKGIRAQVVSEDGITVLGLISERRHRPRSHPARHELLALPASELIVSIGDLVKHRVDELELETNVLRENLLTGH